MTWAAAAASVASRNERIVSTGTSSSRSAPDRGRPLDLLVGVPPVPGVGIHIVRREQVDLVVVAQRTHRESGAAGDLSDREQFGLRGHRRPA